MDVFFKVLKIGALLALIVVLAVLFAPTLKGPFVVIHFSTALRGWLLAQMVLLGFSFAAHRLVSSAAIARREAVVHATAPCTVGFSPAIAPLRC
jgi:hypothetical protein